MIDNTKHLGEGMPRSQAKDRDADAPGISDVEDLFRTYHPRVYAYIRYRVSNVREAEDLTSEIVERALTYLSSYDARKGAFSTWLFRIAHNTWVNHVKKQQRRRPHHADFTDEVENLPSGGRNPEQSVIYREETERLMASLSTLPTRQQEILSLRFAGRLTNREIARILRMNERTVSVTILRALRKLRKQLVESESQ